MPATQKRSAKKQADGGYADLYLLPLAKKNLAKYRAVAKKFGKIVREHGALSYREYIGDDLFPKGTLSFARAAKPKEDEILIAAVVDFSSRAHRDAVMKKMFTDPRLEKMMQEPPLTDSNKMFYGGFKNIVSE